MKHAPIEYLGDDENVAWHLMGEDQELGIALVDPEVPEHDHVSLAEGICPDCQRRLEPVIYQMTDGTTLVGGRCRGCPEHPQVKSVLWRISHD